MLRITYRAHWTSPTLNQRQLNHRRQVKITYAPGYRLYPKTAAGAACGHHTTLFNLTDVPVEESHENRENEVPNIDPAVTAILLRLGLISPGASPRMEALAGGVSSLIVRVDTPRGAVCVKKALAKLRVASDWHAPVERSLAEMAWLKLAGRIVPGAVPRVLGEDRDEMAFVMEFLDPARHPVWKNQLRDGIIEPTVARSVAERLARIHAATAVRPEMAGEFANQVQFHALRLEPYFAADTTAHGLEPRINGRRYRS